MQSAFLKGLSVNEDYDYLWAVWSFDVEIFEFSVPAKLLLNCINDTPIIGGIGVHRWTTIASSGYLKCSQKIFSCQCGVTFYWGSARVNFDNSLFSNCIFTKVRAFQEDSCMNLVSFKIVVLSIQIKTILKGTRFVLSS